jgi:hypothetical protein
MGLLDSFFGNADQTQALGLLGVGMMNGGFAQGAGNAMQFLAGADDRKLKRGLLEAQLAEAQAQAQQRAAQAESLRRQQEIQQAIPGLFRQPGMTGGAAVPQTEGGMPMFSKPMGVTPMQQTPGGFDVQEAIRLGLTPEQIQAYAGLQNVGRHKATRQMEVDDGRGGKRIALVDDFGQEVAGFAGYTAPVQVNRGDRVEFVKPAPGVSLGVNMSPSERDASARGWASVNQGAQRLALEASNAQAGKVPAGYRLKAGGTMEAIPGGPADLKAGAEGQKRITDAKDVLGLLDEVDKLLPKATGSYAGAGVDQAARFFGASTPGAEATAQLKTLQGALIGKMPKMSGPQSDKDVQLYREMAGQVADPTLPISTRQKASQTIRALNEKYAGMPEGSSKQGKQVVKTGKYGGRKVVQYADGTVEYAD